MNTKELKHKALAGPVERQVLNARGEWMKCDTKEAAHWAARGLKIRDLYDFDSATILALIAERDELLANIPEWHCKICNTIHLPPSGFNLCCHTPKCTGMLKPSSQSIRIAEDQRDEALAKLERAQAEIRALESKLLEREVRP